MITTRTTQGAANHPAAVTATPRTVPSAYVPPRVRSLLLRSPEYVSSLVEDVDVRATGYTDILKMGGAVFLLSWYFLSLLLMAAGELLWP